MPLRRLVMGAPALLLLALLLAASPAPDTSVQPAAPVAQSFYGARIAALVDAEALQLRSLNRAFAAAPDEASARQIQHQMDLVKRSAELHLFELQLEELQRRRDVEGEQQLRPMVENLRHRLAERSRRYGIETPTFDLSVSETDAERR